MASLCQNNAHFKACNYSNKDITLRVSYRDEMSPKEKLTLDKNTQHSTSLFPEKTRSDAKCAAGLLV